MVGFFLANLANSNLSLMILGICAGFVHGVGFIPETRFGRIWSTICLADFGEEGIAFVALPQTQPHNLTWSKKGKWVHLAKNAFEKYFMRKIKTGSTDPAYEKYMLKLLGINSLP